MRAIRLGTRGSRLALAQANTVRDLLLAECPEGEVEIVPIKTSGDRGERDGLGVFVREIQGALLRGEIDAGLHCLKDLPTQEVDGLELSAYLEREDPRDALIGHTGTIAELPKGAVVGSGSVRRTAQLAVIRPDLSFKPLVGNVETRLRKLQAGESDAIILAVAGLAKLGLLEDWQTSEFSNLIVSPIPFREMLPAPGQAVLVLETRDGNGASEWTRKLNHPLSQQCACAERAFLSKFGGGCSLPVAAYASPSAEFTGLVASPDGQTVLRRREQSSLHALTTTARAMAEAMLAEGARQLYEAVGAKP